MTYEEEDQLDGYRIELAARREECVRLKAQLEALCKELAEVKKREGQPSNQ